MPKVKIIHFFFLLLLVSVLSCTTLTPPTTTGNFSVLTGKTQSEIWANIWMDEQDWFVAFRDAVYEQILTSNEVYPFFATAKAHSENITSEVQKYIMQARIENLMGQAYQHENQKKKAVAHYKRGKSYAQTAINIQPASESWYALSESIYLLCHIHGFFYNMIHGFSFLNAMNTSVELDTDNPAAQYLLAASSAFAGSFSDFPKALRHLEGLLEVDFEELPKDIQFNAYYVLGFVHHKMKNTEDARLWLEKAIALYPTNKNANVLLGKI